LYFFIFQKKETQNTGYITVASTPKKKQLESRGDFRSTPSHFKHELIEQKGRLIPLIGSLIRLKHELIESGGETIHVWTKLIRLKGELIRFRAP
jgi:hypothetical protein